MLLPYHVWITPSVKLSSPLPFGSHGTTAAAQPMCGDTINTHHMCVDIVNACVLCAQWTCVQVCGSVDAFMCWHAGTPRFNFILHFVASLAACCCGRRIISFVSHRASSSRAPHFVAATVQQQSHSKMVWTTSIRVLARVCVCDVCAMTRKLGIRCLPLLLYCSRVQNTSFLLITIFFFSLITTAAHAQCFFQHKPRLFYLSGSTFNLRHTRDFPSPTPRRGAVYLLFNHGSAVVIIVVGGVIRALPY